MKRFVKLLITVVLIIPAVFATKPAEPAPKPEPQMVPWVWGLDSDGTLLYRKGISTDKPEGTEWVKVSPETTKLRSIAASADGRLWALDQKDGNVIYRMDITTLNPMGKYWVVVGTNKFDQISVGKNDQVYCIAYTRYSVSWANAFLREGIDDKNPYGTIWTQLPRSGSKRAIGFWKNQIADPVHISVGPNGDVWGCATNFADYRGNDCKISNNIFKLATHRGPWLDIAGQLKQIDVGKDGIVWGVNFCDYIYFATAANAAASRWTNVLGGLRHISCGLTGDVWGVTGAGVVLRRAGITKDLPQGTSWTQMDGKLTQIDVGAIAAPTAEEKTNADLAAKEEIDAIATLLKLLPNGTKVVIESNYMTEPPSLADIPNIYSGAGKAHKHGNIDCTVAGAHLIRDDTATIFTVTSKGNSTIALDTDNKKSFMFDKVWKIIPQDTKKPSLDKVWLELQGPKPSLLRTNGYEFTTDQPDRTKNASFKIVIQSDQAAATPTTATTEK